MGHKLLATLFGVVSSSRKQYSGGRSSCGLAQPTLPAGVARIYQPSKGHFGGASIAIATEGNGSGEKGERMIHTHFSAKDDPNRQNFVLLSQSTP